jgi:hypothetical protein
MTTLEEEFAKRKPWITQFNINGNLYGGHVSFEPDTRIDWFYDCFPGVHSILELGSLEGGQTIELLKRADVTITSIEGRISNIEKAKFIKEILGMKNVHFIHADLEKAKLSEWGNFDAVFCSGLLYHLPRPWDLIHEISKITSRLFIWTHYAIPEKANKTINGYDGFWYKEGGIKHPLSGLSRKSYWVTVDSLQKMLDNYGFTNMKIYHDDKNHSHGPAITLGAWK